MKKSNFNMVNYLFQTPPAQQSKQVNRFVVGTIIAVIFILLSFSVFSQNIGINTDGSTPETGVMLDIKTPNTNDKATTAPVQTFFQLRSFDATTDALKLRFGFKTDATATNRYGFIDFPDFTSGTPTYRNLALQPLGGKVGIGTTSPSVKFEVVQASGQAVKFQSDGATVEYNRTPGGDGWQIGGTHVTVGTNRIADILFNQVGSTDATAGAYMVFRTKPDGGVLSERMRITSDGNVGIGTTSPSRKLEIRGTGEAGGAPSDAGNKSGTLLLATTGGAADQGGTIEFGYGAGTFTQPYFAAIKGLGADGSQNTRGHLAFYTRNTVGDNILTERMRIQDNGFVGVGNILPFSKFHISGDGTTNFGNCAVTIENTGTSGRKFSISSRGETAPQRFSISDETASAERFVIDNNGYVGIGTTSPGAKLDISGNIKIVDGSQAAGKVLTSDANGLASWATPGGGSVPQGGIIMYSGAWNFDGTGLGTGALVNWALCNGNNGTPNLADRFVSGTVSAPTPGSTGGTNSYSLTNAQLPVHTHSISTGGAHTHDLKRRDDGGFDGGTTTTAATWWRGFYSGYISTSGDHDHGGTTGSTGSGNPIDNRPAYLQLAFIMKL